MKLIKGGANVTISKLPIMCAIIVLEGNRQFMEEGGSIIQVEKCID